MRLLTIFGPTGVGKSGVAIELADLLRARGEDPVALGCDALQVYRGIEALTGAPGPAERARLEHRLVSFVEPTEEFSAGRFAELVHAEIDGLLAEGRRPILVGGTGLYLRSAVARLELRPPVDPEQRAAVEADLVRRGAAALHAELPAEAAAAIHPNDTRRIARAAELHRAGIEPPASSEQLWAERPRVPTTIVGLTMDRDALATRIDARVREMAAAGAVEEARELLEGDASRTARAALGAPELARGDLEAAAAAHRAYARRQRTWMRKLSGIELIDRTDLDDAAVAARVLERLDADEARAPD